MDAATETHFSSEKKHTPPYVAYKTFKNFVDSLKQAMPGRIDRSVMHTMSGGAQSHVMAALHSMELISRQGIPSEAFKELVRSEGDDRKKAMLSVINRGFPFLFDGSIDLSSATGKQLLEHFGQAPITGNTLRRSVAFFLAAAKDAGLSLSPYFAKIQSRSGVTPKRSIEKIGLTIPYLTGQAEDEDEDEPTGRSEQEKLSPPIGESLSVELKSGGTITLTASTSFIRMSSDDRAFVFDIIDRLQKYGGGAA